MYLSQGQLQLYAAAAGAANPQLAAAVGMAESNGNTGAHNVIPPDDSYGVWQINMYGDMGPERRKQLGLTSNAQLYDPATNARAMVMLSHGGSDFSAWSTYTSGAYKRYLTTSGAQQAGSFLPDLPGPLKDFQDVIPLYGLQDLIGGLTGSTDNPVTHALSALGDIGKAGVWLSKASNWVRIGYVVGGVALAVVGLAMVVKDQELSSVAGSLTRQLGKSAKAAVPSKPAAETAEHYAKRKAAEDKAYDARKREENRRSAREAKESGEE